MREIKFRGKRVDNGEWVEGSFFASHMSGAFILSSKIEARKNRSGGMMMKDKLEQHEVHPATIGQFTGLHDKNGKRIFEGDVLRYVKVAGHTSTGVVKYVTEFARWEYWHTTQKEGFPVLSDCDSMENIGTIHDNPELLP